ncbi:lactoylglutathione lyase-like isoform X1 [Amphiura filiformis]|uniref:lactoylglutathione lyase-like isoform X1 n=1 Tax=Amphiura filiformis TaxID=82378 RepID=UPI003B22403A
MAKSSLNIDEVQSLCAEPDPSTKDYISHHTMLLIKDPRKTLDFYSRILGMRMLYEAHVPALSCSTFYMGFAKAEDIPKDKAKKLEWWSMLSGCIEFRYKYGTDTDKSFKGYHNGQSDPRGFGHIAVRVPNIDDAVKRFELLGVEFAEKPKQGPAYIKDPDGYWIEICSGGNAVKILSEYGSQLS